MPSCKATDVEDEAFALDRVVKTLEPAKRLRLIILDACRDNPFLRTMTRTVASRQIASGLAKVEPDTDTLIAFAAKAGSTADDGAEKHSPFTGALLNNLFEPGIDIRIALGRVRDEVKRATANKQEPFVYGSLGGSTVSLIAPPEAKPVVAAPPVDPHANIRRDYELAAQIGTKRAWESFLEVYKTGFFAELAKEARSKIIAAERAETIAAEAKAKAEAAEKARTANAAAERAKAETAKAAAEAAERARQEAAERARAEAARQQEAQRAEEARKAEEAKRGEEARRAREAKEAQAREAQAKEAQAKEAQAKEGQQDAEAKKLQVAALPANTNEPDVTRLLQTELRRVGCHLGTIDGKWSPASQRSLKNSIALRA